MLVGWSILDSILFYSACLTTSHLRINEHFTSCTVLLKVSRVQLFWEVLILLNHFFFFFLQLFLLQLSLLIITPAFFWLARLLKVILQNSLPLQWKKIHAVCITCPCGPTIHFSFFTMRKNLPKTLDFANIHYYLVNSYHQKGVKHYVLTNWYQMTSI